jgi:hypothetical protein
MPVGLLETCKVPQFYLTPSTEDRHSNKRFLSKGNGKRFSVHNHTNRHIVLVLGRSAPEC